MHSIDVTFISSRYTLKLLLTLSFVFRWFEHVHNIIQEDTLPEDLSASWAAFKAKDCRNDPSVFISTILPLFYEQAKSVAMIQHGMNVIKNATQLLNPDQVPVIAMDQPLFALAKQIQWDKPATFGEDKFLIMLGGLHIEMAAFKTLGDWLRDSGWTEALTLSKVASTGTADSFLKCSHVARTRHAHQVTAAALYRLLQKSYTTYKASLPDDCTVIEFSKWCDERSTYPQFKFWFITLEFQLAIFIFIRAIRERNFSMYIDALCQLMPLFFALDHPNYSRWLSVHVRDMINVDARNPEIAEEFKNGKFALAKTSAPFSAIAIDHAHEQNNGLMKGDGGTIGLTESPSALRR